MEKLKKPTICILENIARLEISVFHNKKYMNKEEFGPHFTISVAFMLR